jgi:hypothetical protein
MPRVLVERPLKWDDKEYPPGVSVDMPERILNSLPPGTVRTMPNPQNYPVHAPPTPKAPEAKGAAPSAAEKK